MYKLIKNSEGIVSMVYFVLNNKYIPFCEENTDYQQYLAWLSEGNQPLPAEVTA